MHERVSQSLEGFLAPDSSRIFLREWGNELLAFGVKNALACLFPAFIFLSLLVTKWFSVPFLPRYDLLLILCLSMQAFMVWSQLETLDELKVICLFHVLGLTMEIYKVHHGAWSYPSFAYVKIGGVPLWSGFMYASVASYITQSWRYFQTRLKHWPPQPLVAVIGIAIYANFFTNEYLPDIRWFIFLALFLVFFRTSVSFTTNGHRRSMPVVASFFLIGLFIWFAENLATFLGAWRYHYQAEAWRVVDIGTITSWFLLVIVSFILVAELKLLKDDQAA